MDLFLIKNGYQLGYIASQHKSSCGMVFANAIIVPVSAEWRKYLGCVAIMPQYILIKNENDLQLAGKGRGVIWNVTKNHSQLDLSLV
jgi:hypothetical protein